MELRGPENTPESAPAETARHPTTRGETPHGRAGITPMERFRFEHQKANFAYWLAGGSMAFALIVVVLVTSMVGRAEKIFVLDAGGNVHYGPLVSLSGAEEMLQTVSVLATETALSRSSVGFDLPEFLRPLFLPSAMRTLSADLDAQQEDLRTRNLHQKPVVASIKGPVAVRGSKRMEITGKLIRSGMYSDRAIYEEADFTLALTFSRNPNIGAVACYPWVVSSIDLTVEDAK